jgi:hypothetical protein
MKRLSLAIILLAYACTTQAQDLKFDLKNYTWNETPPAFTPDSTDKKSPTVYVSMKKNIEYVFDAKGESVELFYLTHTLKYINDDKSIEDNNKIYVSTNDEQKLLAIKTRVIDKGKIVYEATEKDFIQVEEDGRQYNQIALKAVAKGVLIETIISYQLQAELYGQEMFQTNYPVKSAEYMLITPDMLKFSSKIYNTTGTLTDTLYDSRRFTYTKFSNIPALDDDEKYSFINANKIRVEYTYAQHLISKKKYVKWPEMGRIYFDRMNYNYEKNAKDLDKILSKINLKQYKTDEEKVFAIENYMKSNIGIEGNAPETETFADVVKMKYTYASKFNQMCAQLYRKAGISYEIVLTCAKDYKRLDPDFDSWTYLRNVLFYFPSLNKYIDPQETYYRLGKINTDYLGQNGLFIKTITIGDAVSASASVKLIASNDPQATKDFENYTATFDATLENVTVEYRREMNGYAEQGYRGIYYALPEDKRKELMEEFIKGMATESKVTDLAVENYDITQPDVTAKPLIINAKVNTAHYIETAGEDKILFKVGELIGQQMEMYQTKPRVTQVDIPFAHYYIRTIKINIPEGYKVKGLDKLIINHTHNNGAGKPSFGFTSTYKMEGNQLVINCSEYYNDLTYPLSQFEQYKEVINDAADFNKISILIEKQ